MLHPKSNLNLPWDKEKQISSCRFEWTLFVFLGSTDKLKKQMRGTKRDLVRETDCTNMHWISFPVSTVYNWCQKRKLGSSESELTHRYEQAADVLLHRFNRACSCLMMTGEPAWEVKWVIFLWDFWNFLFLFSNKADKRMNVEWKAADH